MEKKWILLPIIATMALSGCSTTGKDLPENNLSSTSAAAMETATTAAPQSRSPESTGAITVISPSALATQDLSDIKCTSDSEGSWSFQATVNNPGTTQRRYTIAIAVVANAVAQGHTMITVDVPAKGAEPVAAKDFAISADPGAICEPVMSVED